jgi:predicted adenylyl cyclase CyaB
LRNIEIKTRVGDYKSVESLVANRAGPNPPLCLRQIDTYFNISEGRLKLREKMGEEEDNELIFYRRPDTPGPKISDYTIHAVAEPQKLKASLADRFGIKTVVFKRRKVFFVENARIHLDQVQGLGNFLEIEVVLSDDDQEAAGESLMRELMELFSIDPDSLLGCSYCDLMDMKGRMPR